MQRNKRLINIRIGIKRFQIAQVITIIARIQHDSLYDISFVDNVSLFLFRIQTNITRLNYV